MADRPGGAVFTLTRFIPQATFNHLRFFSDVDVLLVVAPRFLQVLFRTGIVAPAQRKTPRRSEGTSMEALPLLLPGSSSPPPGDDFLNQTCD